MAGGLFCIILDACLLRKTSGGSLRRRVGAPVRPMPLFGNMFGGRGSPNAVSKPPAAVGNEMEQMKALRREKRKLKQQAKQVNVDATGADGKNKYKVLKVDDEDVDDDLVVLDDDDDIPVFEDFGDSFADMHDPLEYNVDDVPSYNNQYDPEMMQFAMDELKNSTTPSFEEGRLNALEAAVASGRLKEHALPANDQRALQLRRDKRVQDGTSSSPLVSRGGQIRAQWIRDQKDKVLLSGESVPERSVGKYGFDYNGPGKSAILINDIKGKNKLIDRLTAEVDKLTGSLKSCGAEIIRLRNENHDLAKDKQTLKDSLLKTQDVSNVVDGPINAATIRQIPVAQQGRVLIMLGEKLKKEREDNLVFAQKIKALRLLLDRMAQRDKEQVEIRQAHMSSKVYIQQLQDEVAKMPQLKSAITIQEQTIQRLENMLEAQLLKTTQKEVELLKCNAEAMEKTRTVPAGLPSPTVKVPPGDEDAVIVKLKAELQEKDSRIKALEQQMVRNARVFARESTDLKLKLTETMMKQEEEDSAF